MFFAISLGNKKTNIDMREHQQSGSNDVEPASESSRYTRVDSEKTEE